MLPCPSATIWTSTCLGFSTSFSRNTDPLPNAASASLLAPRTASARSSGSHTGRIPRPPPPGARLDQDRETDTLGLLEESLLALVLLARVAGYGRHVGPACELLRPH